MALDWSGLRAFSAVLDKGSLSAAAKAIGLSQPTLGRQIEALERSLRVKLFERTPKGLVATEIGKQLRSYADAMQGHALEIIRRAAHAREAARATVRVSASEMMATFCLPFHLQGIRRGYPAIDIELVASNEVSDLVSLEADIAVRMVRPRSPSLIARKVADVPVGIFACQSLLEVWPRPQTLEELLRMPLIGYDRSQLILKAAPVRGVKLTPGHFWFRCDNQVTCWQAVVAGLGVGFAPLYVAEREPGVVRLLSDFSLAAMPIWLCTTKGLLASAPVRAVYDGLAAGIKSQFR